MCFMTFQGISRSLREFAKFKVFMGFLEVWGILHVHVSIQLYRSNKMLTFHSRLKNLLSQSGNNKRVNTVHLYFELRFKVVFKIHVVFYGFGVDILFLN